MLETRLAELEAAPYGSDKSAAELIGEDFEENKRKYNAKIAAFKEIIEYVKRLREKAINSIRYDVFNQIRGLTVSIGRDLSY